jgi:lysophospholipase L1-like esterase
MRRRPRGGRWLLIVGALVGALVGRILTHRVGDRFVPVAALDQQKWRVISPGLREGMLTPGRGSHVGSGALVLAHHVFYQPDRVIPIVPRPPAGLQVELAPDSAGLHVLMGSPPHGVVTLFPDGVEVTSNNRQAGDGSGRFALTIEDGKLWVDGGRGRVAVSTVDPDRLELAGVAGPARIRAIRVTDADGHTMMDERFGGSGINPTVIGRGTAIGALVGLVSAGGWMVSAPLAALIGTLLMVAPLAGVLSVPAGQWLALVERLYLTGISPDALATRIGMLAMVPTLFGAVVLILRAVWGLAQSRRGLRTLVGRNAVIGLWFIAVLAAFGRASITGGAALSAWSVLGLLWLLLPIWLQRVAPLWTTAWLGLDLVALGALGWMGWGPGLLIATGWRMAAVVSGARYLVRSGAGAAVGLLFLMVLTVLPGMELALRASSLDTAWDPTQLTEERPSQKGWRDPGPSWSGRCGPETASLTRTVMFAGGSSTGGAYQFRGEPEVFFPAQAHKRLCDRLPADTALRTFNFGRGNRDTFTIAHTIDRMMDQAPADLVVLYVGVNDLLASHQPMTRKQREAQRAERSRAVAGLAGLGAQSRLVTGSWLLTRELPDSNQPGVPDVPVPDAIENFEHVADALQARGSALLLTTELVERREAGRMHRYRQAQSDLAQRRDTVAFFDVRTVFTGRSEAEVLVDQNHLTRDGNAHLGAAFADVIGSALGWTPDQGSSR